MHIFPHVVYVAPTDQSLLFLHSWIGMRVPEQFIRFKQDHLVSIASNKIKVSALACLRSTVNQDLQHPSVRAVFIHLSSLQQCLQWTAVVVLVHQEHQQHHLQVSFITTVILRLQLCSRLFGRSPPAFPCHSALNLCILCKWHLDVTSVSRPPHTL